MESLSPISRICFFEVHMAGVALDVVQLSCQGMIYAFMFKNSKHSSSGALHARCLL